MSDDNKIRLAHELLDEINAREDLTPEQTEVLRSFLPERPKQKTLEDVYREVCNAWYRTDGNVWKDETFGELEDWLRELHEQLKGLIDAQPTAPALPAGMRLADHEECGRVVVSPKPNDIGQYKIFHLDDSYVSGADVSYVEADALTFIDGGTFRLSPPEFLETKADYTDVPEGTILTTDGLDTAWVKKFDGWASTGVSYERTIKELGYARRRVLRWGWGK